MERITTIMQECTTLELPKRSMHDMYSTYNERGPLALKFRLLRCNQRELETAKEPCDALLNETSWT